MSTKYGRRDLIGMGAAAVGAVALLSKSATAQPAPAAAAGRYEIKPLPFDPSSIPGLSERIVVSHHQNNYAGAVRRLNTISERLAQLNFTTTPNFVINGIKREELMAMNSMILHELYFDNLGGDGAPDGMLADAIVRDFGSVARWHMEFSAMGKAQGGGSGWVLLSYSPRDGRLTNQWAADHTTTLAGGRPVLALDMYEHAYHMDYGTGAAAYVDVFMNVIRWDNVGILYERYAQG